MAHAQNGARSAARGISGTLNVIGYRLASFFFPKWTWFLPPESGKIAVTFDDGPDSKTTPRLLQALDRNSIPATMFLTGERCSESSLLRDIAAAGHEIANHGFEHCRHALRGAEYQQTSILKTNEMFRNAGLQSGKLFRPPFGAFDWRTRRIAEACGCRGVIWSLMCRDWERQTADELWRRIDTRLHAGAILLLHDGHETTSTVIEILPRLAESVAARGWEFTLL